MYEINPINVTIFLLFKNFIDSTCVNVVLPSLTICVALYSSDKNAYPIPKLIKHPPANSEINNIMLATSENVETHTDIPIKEIPNKMQNIPTGTFKTKSKVLVYLSIK
jgi:hypothetical protein